MRTRNRNLLQWEIEAILVNLPPQLALAWRTALATGARIRELLALKRDDIDLSSDPPTITIAHARVLDPTTGERRFGLKGSSPHAPKTRRVHIAQDLAQTLVARAHPTTDFLFWNPSTGKPISARSAQWWLRRACGAAMMPTTTWHSARHTYATRLSEITDTGHVQALLGHVGSRTTERYLHRAPITIDPGR